MPRNVWRSHFLPVAPLPQLANWLREPASLTARCQRHCQDFRIRLLYSGRQPALADEGLAPGSQPGSQRPLAWVREVALLCDGVPVIFAHTTLAAASRGRLRRWIARLGSRSLGSLLFCDPAFRRGGIEYCRLDGRHPLYRRAAAIAPVGPTLWARRSPHWLGGQPVVVTEVFLPAIAQLGR